MDTSLSLKEISKGLDVNPAYLSREFSKYFDNLSFGEYIRKQRIEKAIELLNNADYTLTEIAYLTGFSDQSHFTRIFKKHTGKTAKESIQMRMILEIKYLLHSTNLSIKEISSQLGFNDPNYFTSFFTRFEMCF